MANGIEQNTEIVGVKPVRASDEAIRVAKRRKRKEAEMKILVDAKGLALVEQLLREEGAKETFRGKNVTRWFEQGLYKKGQSSRIKESVRGTVPVFTATVKQDLFGDWPTVFLKNKDEYEAEAATYPEALYLLAEMRRTILKTRYAEPGFPTLEAEKTRTSYVVPNTKKDERREYKKLEVDLDVLTHVNGIAIEPIYLVEIEDTSKVSARIKERRIRAFAERLGIESKIDAEVASLSTERLLTYLGVISQKEFVVRGVTEPSN